MGARCDAEILPDERAQRGHRTAEFTAEHGLQLVRLFVGCLAIDDGAQPPIAVRHDLGCVGYDHHREPAHIGAVDVAIGYVEYERHSAAVVVGAVRQIEVARAKEFAGACFDVCSPQYPRHGGIVRLYRFPRSDSHKREPPPLKTTGDGPTAGATGAGSSSTWPVRRCSIRTKIYVRGDKIRRMRGLLS